MGHKQYFKSKVFTCSSASTFEQTALSLFQYQAGHNQVYHTYLKHLGLNPVRVKAFEEIPFLPIRFFKSFAVKTGDFEPSVVYSSSATTGGAQSRHFLADKDWYGQTYLKAFARAYGSPQDWCILALLPSYLERQGSSLIDMCAGLISLSGDPDSGFYLHNLDELAARIRQKEKEGKKTLLIGVSFALLDFAENFPMPLAHTTIMETGGMKGRRKELVRDELHHILTNAFKVPHIHSEYGMTELLSQAYSKGSGLFTCPPWMQVHIRHTDDPFAQAPPGKTGGINVVDLANIDSCAFIETMDLGRWHKDATFEVLGRFDHAEVRGCNLLVQ